MTEEMREFETGAYRSSDENKLDFEACLSPLVLKAYAEYIRKHRKTQKGDRADDNWQKGMTKDSYMKGGFRHFMDWWLEHRGHEGRDGIIDGLCGLMFNVQGYLYELLKETK